MDSNNQIEELDERLNIELIDTRELKAREISIERISSYFFWFFVNFNIVYSNFIHFGEYEGFLFKIIGLFELDELINFMDITARCGFYIVQGILSMFCIMILLSYIGIYEIKFTKRYNIETPRLIYLICVCMPLLMRAQIAMLLLSLNCGAEHEGEDAHHEEQAKANRFLCINISDYSVIVLLASSILNSICCFMIGKIDHILFAKEFNEIYSSLEKHVLDILLITLGIFHRTGLSELIPPSSMAVYMTLVSISMVLIYILIRFLQPIKRRSINQQLLTNSFTITVFQCILWVITIDYSGGGELDLDSSKQYFMGGILCVLLLKLHFNSAQIESQYTTLIAIFRKKKASRKEVSICLDSLLNLLSQMNYSGDSPIIQLKTRKLWESLLRVHSEICVDVHCFCKLQNHSRDLRSICIRGVRVLDSMLHNCLNSDENKSQSLIQYLNFLLDVLGNYGLARDYLSENRCNNHNQISYLEKMAFKTKIRSLILHYKECRNFLKPYQEDPRSNQESAANKLMKMTSELHDLIGIVQNSILEANKIQTEIIETLLRSKSFNQCYLKSIEYNNKSEYLKSNLIKAQSLTMNSHPYINLLHLFYYSRIEFNLKKSVATIKQIKDHRETKGLSYLVDDQMDRSTQSYRPVVLLIGNEVDNFHRIIYASGYSEEYLGWTQSQLRGEDLSILLPDPICKFHYTMLSNDSVHGGLLENQEEREIYCLDSNGLLKKATIMISLTILAETGLSFMGMLQFTQDEDQEQSAIIIINKEGKMVEGNKFAIELADIPGSLDQLSDQISTGVDNLTNFISQQHNSLIDFNRITYDELTSSEQDLKLWQLYIQWQQGVKLRILTKENREQCVKFAELRDFAFKACGRKMFFWILTLNTQPLSKRAKQSNNLRKKLKFLFPARNKSSSLVNIGDEVSLTHNTLDQKLESNSLKSEEKEKQNVNIEEDNLPYSFLKSKAHLHQKSSKLPTEDNRIRSLHSKRSTNKRFEERSLYDMFMESQQQAVLKHRLTNLPSRRKIMSEVGTSKKKMQEIKKKNIFGIRDDNQVTKMMQLRHQQSKQVLTLTDGILHRYTFLRAAERLKRDSEILEAYRTENSSCRWRLLTFIVTAVYFIPLAISGVYRSQYYYSINEEILFQSTTIHNFIATLMASQPPVMSMEVCRMLREGVYTQKDFVVYGVEDPYLQCMTRFKLGATSLNHYLAVYSKINMLLFPNLVDRELLICDDLEYTTYRTLGSGITEFYKLPLNLREAMTINSGFTRRFVERDYEHEELIPIHITKEKDRSKDPDEQMFRDNLGGTFNEHINEKLHMFGEYLVKISKICRSVLLYDILITISLTIIYIISILSIFGYFTFSISVRYGEFLNIKVR